MTRSTLYSLFAVACAVLLLAGLTTPTFAQRPGDDDTPQELADRFEAAFQQLIDGEHEAAFQEFSAIAQALPAGHELRVLSLYNAACAASLHGANEAACIRLAEAIRDGYRDLAHTMQDSDLDAIRDEPMYQHLIALLQTGNARALSAVDPAALARQYFRGQTPPPTQMPQTEGLTNGEHAAHLSLRGRLEFVLVVSAEATVRLTTRSDIDPVMELLDSNGRRITRNDDGGGNYQPLIEARLQPGRYTVIIVGFADSQEGDLVLVVSGLPAATTPPTTEPGEEPTPADRRAELEALRQEMYRAVDEEVEQLRRELREAVDRMIEELQEEAGAEEPPAPAGRPFLGVRIRELNAAMREYLELPDGAGIFIEEVTPEDGPAAQAGVRAMDILLSVNGQAVGSGAALGAILAQCRPGDELVLVLRRGTSDVTLTLTLGEAPAEPE